MTEFLEYSDIALTWEDFNNWRVRLPERKSSWRDCHRRFKLVWDSYRIEGQPFGLNETMMMELHRLFPKDAGARQMRPLGDFHEYAELNHRGVYEALVERMSRTMIDSDGDAVSMAEGLWPHVQPIWKKCFPKWKATERDFITGMSLMLFGSSFGIWMEGEVYRLLRLKVAEKYRGHYVVEMAPASMEGKDIDVLIKRSSGETAVRVSVKCNGALSESTVDFYRETKKKTDPDIYVGFKSLDDANVGRPSRIIVSETLDELIRKDRRKWKELSQALS